MLALATTIGDRIHRELAVYGANIIVTPQADALAVKIGGVDLKPATGNAYLHESDLQKLRGIFWANNITGVSPELDWHGSAYKVDDQGNRAGRGEVLPVTAAGLWFDKQFGANVTGALQIHPWWKLQGSWPHPPPHGFSEETSVVIGTAFAKRLDLSIGDRLEFRTSQLDQAQLSNVLRVDGIVNTAGPLDDGILMQLAMVQDLADLPDAVSRVDISARTRPEDAFARKDPDSLSPKQRDLWYCRPYANSIAYQIREAIPGAQAQQVRRIEQSEGAVLSRISGLMWLISAAALLAAGFAVSAAMATAILERRREIGLMRSLGASRGSIALLFYIESAILAMLAGTIGYLAGSGLAAWLGARIFSTGGAAGPAPINLVLLPVVLGLALAVAIGGSTPSIRSALRMNPSEVLRADA